MIRTTGAIVDAFLQVGKYRLLSTGARPSVVISSLPSIDEKGIRVMSLDRPDNKNALSRQLLYDFKESINVIKKDTNVRVLVIRSLVKNVFCSGADLKERETMSELEVRSFLSLMRSVFSSLENLNIPTIACVDGYALGGGLELAMCCDLRVAGLNAKLGLPETKLAVIPGAGGTQRLPRLVGIAKAKELIYTGRIISSDDAAAIGLVNQVSADPFVESINRADEITPQGPIAVSMAKKAIDHGYSLNIEQGLDIENRYYDRVLTTKDRLEGIKAFLSKRKPNYAGG